MKIKFNNIYITSGIFIALLFLSFFVITYFLKYSVLSFHDYWLFHNRPFFSGQHGRYISTIVLNLLLQKIPDMLNMHPQDCNATINAYFKAFLIIVTIICYTFSCFLFNIKNSIKINFAHIILYLTLFLILFNNNYIFNNNRIYMCSFENAVFFEYPMSMLIYIPFWAIFTYIYVNNIELNKLQTAIFVIMSVLLAINIEIINIPSLISLFVLFIIFLLFKQKGNWWKYSFISYLAGIGLFLAREKGDFTPSQFNDFLNFIKIRLPDFIDCYFNGFIKEQSLFLIPIIILAILIIIACKNKSETKKFICCLSVNIICLLFFYFLTFFLAGTDSPEMFSDGFPINYNKWHSIYKMTLLFWLLISFSYFTDNNNYKIIKDKSNIIKILTCIFILFIFRYNLLTNYINEMQNTMKGIRDYKLLLYSIEKLSLNDKSDNIIIPEEYKENVWFSILFPPEEWYINNFNYVHKREKKNIIYSKNIDTSNLLTEKELKELKFSNLINLNQER